MSEKHNHIDQLTPEILLAYRKGQLTNAQMHQVEKLMLDDPFYSDALEGLEEFTEETINQDLDHLDQRLNDLLESEESPFPWYKLTAAVVLILVVAGIFWFQQEESPQPKPIEEWKPANTPSSSSIMTEEEPVEGDSLIIDTTFIPEIRPGQTLTAEAPTAKEEEDNEIEMDETLELDIEISEETVFEETLEVADIQAQKPQVLEVGLPMKSLDKNIDSMENFMKLNSPQLNARQSQVASRAVASELIKGKVTGADDGLPLPQVNVLIKGTTEGVPTNIDGEYAIRVPNGENQTLAFRYLGYISQEIEIGSQKEINVQLEPDVQSLGEVVVTGYGKQEDEEVKRNAFARPENGFQDLNRYLRENIQYPEEHKGSRIKGNVTVVFTIETDGRISKIRVNKSLGEAFDQEAIRLIKNGPSWEPATDREGNSIASEMKVSIRFRERD